MGRLLDIARAVPNVVCVPDPQMKQIQRTDQESVRQFEASNSLDSAVSAKSAISPSMQFSQPAADVLDMLAKSEVPLPHTAILKRLAERGHTKKAGCLAIRLCQRRGWIWHNLVTGYVMMDSMPEYPIKQRGTNKGFNLTWMTFGGQNGHSS